MFKKKISLGMGSALVSAALLSGCGGGTTTSGGSGGGASTVSGVITGFGSVYVNGVEYETDGAGFTIDGQPATELDLDVGMVVTLQGSSSGTAGTATSIVFNDELEGAVVANNIAIDGTLDVMGITVVVDANTVFDAGDSGIAAVDGIIAGNIVEVSGYPSADGSIFATRLEVKAIDGTDYQSKHPGQEYELKGVVASLGASTFMLGSLTVDYSNVSSMPVLSDGLYVEVKSDSAPSSGVLSATKIELEDDGELGHDGDEGEEIEIRGLVTDISGLPDSFSLNGQTVLIGTGDGEAEFDPTTLQVGMTLMVEGHFDANGDLVLDGIEKENEGNLEFSGSVEAVDSAAGTITLFGKTFSVTTSTMMKDEVDGSADFYFDITDIQVGDYLSVELYHDAAQDTLTATRIERNDAEPVDELSGIVDSVATSGGFTVAGVSVAWGGTLPQVGDEVELSGSYASGVFTATDISN